MMTSEQLAMQLVHVCTTTADVSRRLALIRSYMESEWFHTRPVGSIDQFLQTISTSPDDVRALVSLGEGFYGSFDKDHGYEKLKQIADYIKIYKTIKIYAAIDLDSAAVQRIRDWLETQVDTNILIEMFVDTSIVAGCRIVWNGIERDYSIDALLQLHKEKLREMLSAQKTSVGAQA